jgi:hypothetical protein
MSAARSHASATTLANGKVLVVGGMSNYYSNSNVAAAELYDPATGTFSYTGTLVVPRNGHVPARLADGNVIVTGGTESSGMAGRGIERYDVGTGTWSAAGRLLSAHSGHTASLLNDDVLIAGGSTPRGSQDRAPLRSVGPSGFWSWRLSPSTQTFDGFGGTLGVGIDPSAAHGRLPAVLDDDHLGHSWKGIGPLSIRSRGIRCGPGALQIAEVNFQNQGRILRCLVVSPTNASYGESGGSGSMRSLTSRMPVDRHQRSGLDHNHFERQR